MIHRLDAYNSDIDEEIRKHAEQYGLKNVFNPSILFVSADEYICSVRALYHSKAPPFEAFLIQKVMGRSCIVNLTLELSKYNIDVVADPKLFKLAGQIWCTFNTGYVNTGENKIFIVKVFPEISEPIECIYAERETTEKNWAFFIENNTLKCLYSMSPLVVLKTDSKLRGGCFEFEIDHKESLHELSCYSIATPLMLLGGRYFFWGHNKVYFRNKRLYLGKLFEFTTGNEKIQIKELSSKYFVHNLKSLLGSTTKWNKNLMSCTYISGMSIRYNDVYVSYGINDIDFRIAKLPKGIIN